MPNPLQILAGLAQVGASGTGGAYQGAVEAPFAKQQLQTGEIENQLRLLRGLALQQSLGPQYTVDNHGRIILQTPGQAPQMTGAMPPAPLSDLDRARIGEYESLAALHRRQTQLAGTKAGSTPTPHYTTDPQGNVTAIVPRFDESGQMMLSTQTLRGIGPQAKEPAGAKTPTPHYITDAQGNVTAVVPRVGESGAIDFSKSPLGQIGKAARAPAGLTPRETVTTTTKITPRKEITNTDEIAKISQALPNVVNEIASNPAIVGWMHPGAFVQIQGYPGPVRREDVIARAMLKRAGIGVNVQWDGRQWKLVRAWIPEQKEPVESRRTTGPPRQSQAESEDEE